MEVVIGLPYGELVNEYVALQQGKTGLVVFPTHREGKVVTTAIRHKLRDAGMNGKQEITFLCLVNLSMTAADIHKLRIFTHYIFLKTAAFGKVAFKF